MNIILKELSVLKVAEGETLFLRPSANLRMSEIGEIRSILARAELKCRVVFLPVEIEVCAVAE